VGITVENWTNQRLEFPELNTAEGAVDREKEKAVRIQIFSQTENYTI
jgi:hypothetical protein